ncbi:6-carboxytetrahydropterin synthase [Macrococcus armenti]|uniref:6-pyruvoyl trahydropterin synthase family protein n=1 Tax=Macrococcus armenti TaxID=2875764 RepID=UPI001CC9E989|nr:6-carboxytetrahydropterin synthase [Macrococcus armenti]UBH22803.1 6-carboxytetrahydropterin synthase [Macrococcus armenti]
MQNILNNVKNTSNPYYHELIYLQLDFSFKTSSRIFFSDTLYKYLIEHLYKFTITISSKVNENGIAVDFFYIRNLYDNHLSETLNSNIINLALPNINPTAENLCYYIWTSFNNILPENVSLEEITFSECDQHRVIINRNHFV